MILILKIVAAFASAVVLAMAMALTLNHATFPMSGTGTLKCYSTDELKQRPC